MIRSYAQIFYKIKIIIITPFTPTPFGSCVYRVFGQSSFSMEPAVGQRRHNVN